MQLTLEVQTRGGAADLQALALLEAGECKGMAKCMVRLHGSGEGQRSLAHAPRP